ncbi:hypothetical protein [Cysteiniphilum marinum]|uniref:hypothetical protein n=1 Tax=Cysteiniphilum marinum TaxID=2774191 RepID=UPI001939EE4E|nr:hypothetical protein [Cysteiniphilum marinum]
MKNHDEITPIKSDDFNYSKGCCLYCGAYGETLQHKTVKQLEYCVYHFEKFLEE